MRVSAASRKYGLVSGRCPGAFPLPVPGARGRRSLRSLGGGLRSWLAVRGTCTAALRSPGVHSRKIPAFEGRCSSEGFVALPHRTAAGTLRSGASPEAAHRPSRCTASSATDPGRPASLLPLSFGLLRYFGTCETAPARCRFRSPQFTGDIPDSGERSVPAQRSEEPPAASFGTGSHERIRRRIYEAEHLA
jgi:hypothetical protein